MFFRKTGIAGLAFLLSAFCCTAMAANGGRQIEAQSSVEAPAPDVQGMMSPQQLKELSDLRAATEIAEARRKLEEIEVQRLEQRKKIDQLMAPPAALLPKAEETAADEKNDEAKAEAISRVFPMPGGNPQVTAIIGGNRKALEATLKFPSGAIYEVTKGMVLEGGYRVARVSGNGVVLEKNGLALSMPVSQGDIQKPWDSGPAANIPEQGVPANDSAAYNR